MYVEKKKKENLHREQLREKLLQSEMNRNQLDSSNLNNNQRSRRASVINFMHPISNLTV